MMSICQMHASEVECVDGGQDSGFDSGNHRDVRSGPAVFEVDGERAWLREQVMVQFNSHLPPGLIVHPEMMLGLKLGTPGLEAQFTEYIARQSYALSDH